MVDSSVVINLLSEVSGDDLPKTVQQRLQEIIVMLQNSAPLSRSRARDALEELSNYSGVESFTRSRLFNAMSLLE